MTATGQALDVRVLRSIPTPVADSLLAQGCRTAGDVLGHPQALKEALAQHHAAGPESKAKAMLNGCQQEASAADAWASADSALELLRQAQAVQPLVLPCGGLTSLLGNSMRPGGTFLEVYGLPGSGKTQFCLQLCAAAQIPILRGPVDASGDAEAVFVDTEGSFVPRRYLQVCRALLKERRSPENPAHLEGVLRRLHVCRTYDATELYATLKNLKGFLKARPKVRVLVVDSIAFSFRHELMENMAQRARVLADIAATLRGYGADHNLVIVVTNHMTTRFEKGREDGGWLAPALGETWAHQPSTQLRLEKMPGNEGLSRATLTKSVEQAAGRSCLFRIEEAGLRDAVEAKRPPIQSGYH
mmetsp:Transcript_12605/g.22263  ORF Transcript_12605/g.22263 Transcript_12605/m.22263 type:complete len:358 (+) Transcript_12605:53-1126(+)